MLFTRNQFCLTAVVVVFSVCLLDAAPITRVGRNQAEQVSSAKKKEKAETKPLPLDESSYYVTITGGGHITVADDFGNSNTPLVSSARGNEIGNFIAPKVPNVSVDVLGKERVQIVMPSRQNYTLSFRSSSDPISITLIEGESDATPQRAVRYVDLVLPANAPAMFRFTSKGVEPLRYDRDGDGIYESIALATVDVSGSEARDVTPPVVKLSARLEGEKKKVTIKANDSGTGVKIIYYSLDNKRYQPYLRPLVLDAGNNPSVSAFADDRVGNRSAISSLPN